VIGTTVYDLPRSEDPTSVMAKDLYGSHSTDLMSDEFDGLGSLAVIDGFVRTHWLPAFTPTVTPAASKVDAKRVDGSYPCVLARRDRSSGATATGWQAQVTKCLPQTFTDTEVDELEIDLRNGALMTRETDLFLGGTTPIALTRCYRSWDERIRTFGYNRGMSWDMYPNGSRNPYTYIDIILCDSRTIHYERISQGSDYANALYEHKDTATPFLRSRFGWTGNGWDLGRSDGTHMYFPESYNAKRSVDGGLVAFTSAKGEVVALQRDPLRNLRKLSTADGKEMQIEYDALNRVAKARDHLGRVAEYRYDMAGRLAHTKTSAVERRYTYAGTYLESMRENGQSLFQLRYHRARVSELILANGQNYKLRYDYDSRDNYTPVQPYLTSPDGKTEKFTISPKP
jgi:YD repeat-containing protein